MKISDLNKQMEEILEQTKQNFDSASVIHRYKRATPISSKWFVDTHSNLTVEEMKWYLTFYNRHNRPIDYVKLWKMIQDIKAGRFDSATGNTVCFSESGDILDCQHRLWAHVICNRTLDAIVVFGLPPEAILHKDQSKRAIGVNEVLYVHMSDSPTNITRPTKGDFSRTGHELRLANAWLKLKEQSDSRSSTTAIREFKDENIAVISKVLELCKGKRIGFQAAVCMYFEIDGVKAEEFARLSCGGGSGLPDGSPCLKMRDYLMKAAKFGGEMQQKEDYSYAISMIHKYHKGETVDRISKRESWETLEWFQGVPSTPASDPITAEAQLVPA